MPVAAGDARQRCAGHRAWMLAALPTSRSTPSGPPSVDASPMKIDFSDLEGLEQEAEAGARLGMAGKHVIHPVQVAPVHAAFSPSSDAVAYARELVRAFKQHQREGRGAFTFRGRMIDNPTFLQAQNLSAYATWIGME